MVFLRLETSCVFAFSPRYLALGPKPTREGVARLETSLAMTSTPRFLATACVGEVSLCTCDVAQWRGSAGCGWAYNHCILSAKVETDDTVRGSQYGS